ncbi:hypothetical protein CIB48_g3845 [Xylaria polymorpha]|nr:hypothetical protein CIB48_g3845 [Xylaria polymorpha]
MPPQRRRIDELQDGLWKENKTTLRRLYLEERRTLKDVKKAMESEYGFPVTPLSTYEYKLRELGLRKKMKKADWYPVYQHYVNSGNRHTVIYFNGTRIPWDKAWKEIRRSGARESIDYHATELPVDVVMRSPSPVLGGGWSTTSLRYMMPVPWRLSDVSLEALIPAAVDYRANLYKIPSNLLRMEMHNNSEQFFSGAGIETGLINQALTLSQRDSEHLGLVSDIDRLYSALYRLANNDLYLTGPGKALDEPAEVILNLTPKTVLLKILATDSQIIRAALERLVEFLAQLGWKDHFTSLIEITWRLHPDWTFSDQCLKFAADSGCIDSCRILLQMLRWPTPNPCYDGLFFYLDATLLSLAKGHIECAKFLIRHAIEPNTTLQRLDDGFAHNRLFRVFLDTVSAGFYHPPGHPRYMFELDNPAILHVLDWFLESGANVDLPASFESPWSPWSCQQHTFQNWMPTLLDVIYFQNTRLYSLLVDHSVKFKAEPTRSGIHYSASEGIEPLRMYLLSRVSHTPAEQDAFVDIVLAEEFSRDGNINFDVIRNLLDYNLGLQASRLSLNISAMLFYVIEKAQQQGPDMHPAVPNIVKTLTQGGAIIVDKTIHAAVNQTGTTFLQLLSCYGADFQNQGALALYSAVRFGNYDAVNWLLEKGVDINATIQYDLTERKNEEPVKITIIARASIKFYGSRYVKIFDHGVQILEQTPTISYNMFEYLLYRGAKLKASPTDTSPRQLLRLVIGNGRIDDKWEDFFKKIKLILDTEPLRDDESRVDRCPLEPCFWGPFITNGLGTLPQRLLLMDYLLKCALQRDVFGRTALQAACEAECDSLEDRTNKINLIKFLIASGADVNAPPAPMSGITAFQCAAMKGDFEVALLLLDNGADINASPSCGSRSALDGAVVFGRIDMVQFLLNLGAVSHPGGESGYRQAINCSHNGAITDLIRQYALKNGKSGEELSTDWHEKFEVPVNDTDDESDAEIGNETSWEDWLTF